MEHCEMLDRCCTGQLRVAVVRLGMYAAVCCRIEVYSCLGELRCLLPFQCCLPFVTCLHALLWLVRPPACTCKTYTSDVGWPSSA
mgnify:CR=1 FL=1